MTSADRQASWPIITRTECQWNRAWPNWRQRPVLIWRYCGIPRNNSIWTVCRRTRIRKDTVNMQNRKAKHTRPRFGNCKCKQSVTYTCTECSTWHSRIILRNAVKKPRAPCPRQRQKNFFFSKASIPNVGSTQPTQQIWRVKRNGCGADHSAQLL